MPTETNHSRKVKHSPGHKSRLLVPSITMTRRFLHSLFRGSLWVLLFSRLAEANNVYFPQVAVGDGYSTVFTLINTDSVPLHGQLRVFNQDGSPRATPVEWESILIPPAGSARFTLSNRGKLAGGSAYFQTSASVSGMATFERRNAGGPLETLVSLLGTAASSVLSFRLRLVPLAAPR